MKDMDNVKLLRFLLRECIPDEKHPFHNPSELMNVVSSIKTHKLLSEWAPKCTDKKLIDEWKSAVDRWVNRLLTLASSNMPDKCWAGICLLGLTCQDCSSEHFLASYSVWFSKLLSHIQPPADSHFVRAASCASISDLLIRLSGFPNTKKDGTSKATRLIQPVLKLLDEDSSDIFWQEALFLLCTIMNCFPYSVHRLHDSIEAAIVLKIMSGNCSASVLKPMLAHVYKLYMNTKPLFILEEPKLGNALCLLPKSKGDEDSWSSTMQKILLSINNQLNDAFQGLEEEARSNETMRILLPPGKEPPQPLGGQALSQETSDVAMRWPEQLLVSRLCTLMHCCCTMPTNSYPVQVPMPVHAVISLAGRVLTVDGSLSQSLYPSMTTMKQELICSELHFFNCIVWKCSLQLLMGCAGYFCRLSQLIFSLKLLEDSHSIINGQSQASVFSVPDMRPWCKPSWGKFLLAAHLGDVLPFSGAPAWKQLSSGLAAEYMGKE